MQKHILTIDDEAEIRDLLAQFLTASGYRVTAAGSAAEARKTAQSDPPDLIITDLQLEDSDGLKLVEQLHTLRPDTPVILLTGVLFDPNVVEKTISTKVAAYVAKTSSLKHLLHEVQRLVGT